MARAEADPLVPDMEEGWLSRHLPVGLQLLFGVAGLLLLVIVSGLIAIAAVVRLQGDAERFNDGDLRYVGAIDAAALSAKGAANDERGFLMSGDSAFVDEARRRIDQARTAFALAGATATGSAQRRAADNAHAGFESWVDALNLEFSTYAGGDRRSSVTQSLGATRETRKAYETELATAQALGARAMDAQTGSFATTSTRSVQLLVAWLVAAMAVGGLLGFWVVRSIAVPLHRLVDYLAPA